MKTNAKLMDMNIRNARFWVRRSSGEVTITMEQICVDGSHLLRFESLTGYLQCPGMSTRRHSHLYILESKKTLSSTNWHIAVHTRVYILSDTTSMQLIAGICAFFKKEKVENSWLC